MLKINQSFRRLIRELTPDEFQQLENNCLTDGILESIKVWQGYIIDGHNRYAIAQKHKLPYDTVEMFFDSEDDVTDWMINNQMGRRNLTESEKSYLRGELYSSRKKRHGGERGNQHTIEAKAHFGHLPNTAEIIAAEQNVSKNTIKRDEKFKDGVNVIETIAPEIKQEILQEKSSLTKTEIQEFAQIPKQVEKEVRSDAMFMSEEDIQAKVEALAKERAKELLKEKEIAKQERIEKRETKIFEKAESTPISEYEQGLINKCLSGETVVINMNKHTHVLAWAKQNGKYQQIDRYSEYGNPFYLEIDGDRNYVCDSYRIYLDRKLGLHQKVLNLKGKVLGCHCHPERCHGDEIIQFIKDNENE